MNLLDGRVVLAIVVAALVCTTIGFFIVVRPGKGVKRAIGRVLTVIVVQACVLAALGALINLQFAYFRNPTEVVAFAAGSNGGGKVEDVPPVVDAHGDESETDSRYKLTWKPSSDEGMTTTTLEGPESGITAEMRAWVPRGYPQEGVKYNVILLIPGTPGNAGAIGPAIGAPAAIQKAIDEGKIPPTILVTSDINFGGKVATCADISGGQKAETWFAKDLPRAVHANFNVTSNAEGWSIFGPSMGGYCAGRIGILHPEVYGNAAWIHGINRPLDDSFPKIPSVISGQRLSVLYKKAEKTGNLMLISSTADPGTVDDARAIAAAAPDPHKVFHDERKSGGHGWVFWVNEFPDILTWLSQVHPVK